MRTFPLVFLVAVLVPLPCAALPWEGTWASRAEDCAKAPEVDGSFSLSRDGAKGPGYSCKVRVERGRGPDLLVMSCTGAKGGFVPSFNLVDAKGDDLDVASPLRPGSARFHRCPAK